MERYFLKFVKVDGLPGKRPMNFECAEDAIIYALDKMDKKFWLGWALYDCPDAWNWEIIPSENTMTMLCMSPDWMKLI